MLAEREKQCAHETPYEMKIELWHVYVQQFVTVGRCLAYNIGYLIFFVCLLPYYPTLIFVLFWPARENHDGLSVTAKEVISIYLITKLKGACGEVHKCKLHTYML